MIIKRAEFNDLDTILNLQYLSYQSEAKLNNNYNIPPLLQTIEDLRHEYQNGIILKSVDDLGTILGSVRGYVNGNTLYIGKLIVHPDLQGKGIGTKLLRAIEQSYPNHRYELFTSNKSLRNIQLYEYLGYKNFKEESITSDLTMVYLEKNA